MASSGGITISTNSSALTNIYNSTANGSAPSPNVATVTSDAGSGDSIFLFLNGSVNVEAVIPPGGEAAIVCKEPGGITRLDAYAGSAGTTTAYFAKVLR